MRKKPQTCYARGCKNKSIRSHILQKQGILSKISKKSLVVELESLGPAHNKFHFRTRGISDRRSEVLTYWGFCNSCDSKIFGPIEGGKNADYHLYMSQMLLSYRGYFSEVYKKQYNVKYAEKLLNLSYISTADKRQISESSNIEKISLFDALLIRNLFHDEIDSGYSKSNFTFHTIQLGKLDVFSSTCYSHPTALPIVDAQDYVSKLTPDNVGNKLHSLPIFFNLIPEDDGLLAIIGWPNVDTIYFSPEYPEKKMDFTCVESMQKYVSDVLIKRVESWGMSVDTHQGLKENGADEIIIKLIYEHLSDHKKGDYIDFNLFDFAENH